MAYALGVEPQIPWLLNETPEESDGGGHRVYCAAHCVVEAVSVFHELVERDEESRACGFFDHRHHAAGQALAVFAFERERRSGEDDRPYSKRVEPLDDLERRAAAGSAAERRHHYGEPHAFDLRVYRVYGVLGGKPRRDKVAAGAVAGQPVSAYQEEVFVVRRHCCVGVNREEPQVFAEGAANPARDGGTAAAYADEHHG